MFQFGGKIIDRKYLDDIINLCKKKAENSSYRLPLNCTVVYDETEGKRLEYHTTKCERIAKYRREAIRFHRYNCNPEESFSTSKT